MAENRRIIGKVETEKTKQPKKKEAKPRKDTKDTENESMISEIIGVIRKRSASANKEKADKAEAAKPKKEKKHGRRAAESPFLNPVAEYLPIDRIENGIIYKHKNLLCLWLHVNKEPKTEEVRVCMEG